MPRLRIGLTGGIGAGKSSVAALLAEHGAAVIDADELARAAVAPGTPGLRDVVARFGPSVLDADGRLDRAALARIVFADAASRADLNAIVHPEVRRLAAEREAATPGDAVVVHVIPLLVETGQAGDFDAVVVVDAPDEVRLSRVMRRDTVDEDAARARIAAQADRADRLAAATHVIDNSADPGTLRAAVDRLWEQLQAAHGATDAGRRPIVGADNYPR